MKVLKSVLALSSFLFAGSALAVPISGTGLQDALNGVTVGPNAGVSSTNVNTDQLAYDETWAVAATGGSVSTLIIEIASLASSNVFGVYDVTNPGVQLTLFSGADAAGKQVAFGIAADGSVLLNFADSGIDFAGNNFGYFISSAEEGTFYSQTGLNADGVDHMVAFAGNGDEVMLPGLASGIFGEGEYVLAFEDLYGGGDRDYEDLVVMVESVNPTQVTVSEPATLALFGLGLAALGFGRRKSA